jgi:hypothetical protein
MLLQSIVFPLFPAFKQCIIERSLPFSRVDVIEEQFSRRSTSRDPEACPSPCAFQLKGQRERMLKARSWSLCRSMSQVSKRICKPFHAVRNNSSAHLRVWSRMILTLLLALCLLFQVEPTHQSKPTSLCGVSNARPLLERLVVFNRVPKVGSTSLLLAFTALHHRKRIRFLHSQIFTNLVPASSDALGACRMLRNVSILYSRAKHLSPREEKHKPLVFDQHTRFSSFYPFHLPTPVYINVIREPVQRLVSGYVPVCAARL